MLALILQLGSKQDTGGVVFINQISLFELFSVFGIIIAVISFVLSVLAARSANANLQAKFSFELWQAFMRQDVQRAYHEIEWGSFCYPYDTTTRFESEDQEYRIDKLLYLFDEIALQMTIGALPKAHSKKWRYHGRRIFMDSGVQNYITFLDGFFQENGATKPFMVAKKVFVVEAPPI